MTTTSELLLPDCAAAVRRQRCCSPRLSAADRSDARTAPNPYSPADSPEPTPEGQSHEIQLIRRRKNPVIDSQRPESQTWWELRPMMEEYARIVMKISGWNTWSVPGILKGFAKPIKHRDRAWKTSSKIISPVLSSWKQTLHSSKRSFHLKQGLHFIWRCPCYSVNIHWSTE